MKRILAVATLSLLTGTLAACSDAGNNQKDPIDNSPPRQDQSSQQGQNTAPTDRSPAPSGGDGGSSSVQSPTGTTQR